MPGARVQVSEDLLVDMIDSLSRVPCQFWACKGPQVPPVGMQTCHRCWTLYRLRLSGLADPEIYQPVTPSPARLSLLARR